jgi:hypothetical protein
MCSEPSTVLTAEDKILAISPGNGALSLLECRIQGCIDDEKADVAETGGVNVKAPVDPRRTTKAQNIEAYTAFKDHLASEWTSVDQRIFARVQYAPQEGLTADERAALAYEELAIEEKRTRTQPLPWFRDYCLLELTSSQGTPRNGVSLLELNSGTPRNEICLPKRMPHFFVEHLQALASSDVEGRQARHDRLAAESLKLVEVIPVSDLARGKLVFKEGSSGYTQAGSSPAWSAINVGGQAYKAWAVLSANLDPFSDQGDSGAVVWISGLRGAQVGGLVTGRATAQSSTAAHVTYATPMEWILDDLRRNGFDVGLL